jgi:hypothetical protein
MGWTPYFYGENTVFEGLELQTTKQVDMTSDLLWMDTKTPCETTTECHRMRLMSGAETRKNVALPGLSPDILEGNR